MELKDYLQLQEENAAKYEQTLKDLKENPQVTVDDKGKAVYDRLNVGASFSEDVWNTSFGKSRYDRHIFEGMTEEDVNQQRATTQRAINQWASGLGKATVLAGTTAVDGILGTAVGLIQMGAYAISKTGTGEFDWSELGSNFTNNILSNTLQKVNKWSEEVIPNYYTEEEMYNRENGMWYKNIGTANFLADGILKNTGFMVGAMVAAQVNAGALTKVMGMSKLREAFKGVTIVADKAVDTSKAIRTGDLLLDSTKLTEDLIKVAKTYNARSHAVQVVSSLFSAAGEGRIEAINNAEDFVKANSGTLEMQKQEQLANLENALLEEHPEWFSYEPVADDEGNITAWEKRLTDPVGLQELDRRTQMIQANYEMQMAKLYKSAATVANKTFAMNVAILGISDYWQFGRYLLGAADKAGVRNISKFIKGSVSDLERGALTANKAAKFWGYARAVSNPVTEALEEMNQAVASTAAGYYAIEKHRLTDMYGLSLDPDANKEATGFLNSVIRATGETYGDISNYEEGFAGLVGAVIGMPGFGIHGRVWNNAMIDGIRETNQNYKEAKAQVEAINKRMQDPEFRSYYQGLVQHLALQNEIDKNRMSANDFMTTSAKFQQFVSDIQMMDRAGRGEEFRSLVRDMLDVKDEDIDVLKAGFIAKDGTSPFDGKTDEQIKDMMKASAKELVDQMETYSKISDSLHTLYGESAKPEVLEELAWKMSNVTRLENEGQRVYAKIIEILQNKINEVRDKTGNSLDFLSGNYEELLSNFTSEDKNLIADIYKIISDSNIPEEKRKELINKRIEWHNAELSKVDEHKEKVLTNFQKRADEYKANTTEKLNNSSNDPLDLKTNAAEVLKAANDAVLALNLETQKSTKALYKYVNSVVNKLSENSSRKEVQNAKRMVNALITTIQKAYDADLANRTSKVEGTATKRKEGILSSIKRLNDEISKLNFVNPLDQNALINDIYDLIKIQSARAYFIDLYTTLASNPKQFEKEVAQRVLEMQRTADLETLRQFLSDIESCTDYKKFRDSLEEFEPRLVGVFFDKINKGDNELLKQFINSYIKIEKAYNIISNSIKDSEKLSSDARGSLINILNDAAMNASSYEEFEKEFFNTENIPVPEVKEFIDNFKEDFNTLKNSAEATNTDTKEADNPVDVPEDDDEGKPGEFDFGAESDEEAGAEYDSEHTPVNIEVVRNPKKPQDPPTPPTPPAPAPSPSPAPAVQDNPTPEGSNTGATPANGTQEVGTTPATPTPAPTPITDSSTDSAQTGQTQTPEDKNTVDEDEYNYDRLDEQINNFSIKELEECAAGNFNGKEDLPTEIVEYIKTKARLRLESMQPANDPNAADPHTDVEEKEEEEPVNNNGEHVGIETDYDYEVLSGNKPISDDTNETRRGFGRRRVNDVVKKLREFGAYEYLQRGMLAEKLAKDKDARIHMVHMPSEFGDRIALAVKLNNGDPCLRSVNINGERYQIVGVLQKSSKLTRTVLNERSTNDDSPFVSEVKLVTTKIYTGQPIKSTQDANGGYRDVSDVFLGGPGIKYALGLIKSDGRMSVGEQVSSRTLVNRNNPNNRAGTVWLLVRQADGKYYPKAVRVKRFNSTEYSEESYGNTDTFNTIREYVKSFVDPKVSMTVKNTNKSLLKNILYIPAGSDFHYNYNKGKLEFKISNYNNGKSIIDGTETVDEATEKVIKALMAQNYRFQIKERDIKENADRLIKDKLLSIDLFLPTNVAASFYVKIDDGTTGNNTNTPTRTVAQRKTVIDGSYTVYIGYKRYRVYSNGVIFDNNNKEVTNQRLKDEILFRSKILQQRGKPVSEWEVKPIDGDPNYYVGFFSDGTEFGLRNNALITDPNEIKKFKDAAAKLVERRDASKKREKVAKEIEKETADETQGAEITASPDMKTGEGFALDDLNEIRSDKKKDNTSDKKSDKPVEKPMEKPTEKPKVISGNEAIGNTNTQQRITIGTFFKANEKVLATKSIDGHPIENALDLSDYCEAHGLVDPATLTTQEQWDALLKDIIDCT